MTLLLLIVSICFKYLDGEVLTSIEIHVLHGQRPVEGAPVFPA